MKKALLLHAWGNANDECWFPWLQKELEKKWYEVCSHNLPSTEFPVFKDQFDTVKDFASTMKEWDLIVWHSLGCTLASHVSEKLELKWINIILVAPTYPLLWAEIKDKLWKYFETLEAYYGLENSFAPLGNNYQIFLSDNDPYITIESAKKYYSNFKDIWKNIVSFNILHEMYHFSDDAPEPIKEVPEILKHV